MSNEEFEGKIIAAADRFQERFPEPEGGWDAHDQRVAEQMAYLDAKEHLDAQREKLVAWGVPRKLHGTILTEYDVSKAVGAMRVFHVAVKKNQEHLAVLSGRAGTGKSLAASIWLLHATASTSKRRVIVPRRFANARAYCRISEFDKPALDAIEQARFLVLDDLGLEYGDKRQFYAARIDGLLNQRHGEELPTVITTNLSAQDLGKAYGDRVASRLNDANVTLLRGEPDRRRKR